MIDLDSLPPVDIPGVTEPDFVEVRGLRTAYRRFGDGEPLLFLHGMGGSNAWLDHHRLFATQFDLIAPQHPGFGRTPRPAWYRNVDDYVAHYADLLDALGVNRTHVVGHSFGGVVGAAFAATYPERVLSFTAVAPLPLPIVRGEDNSHDGPAPSNLMEMLFGDDAEKFAAYDPPEDYGMYVAEADDELSEPGAWSFDPSPGLYRRLARISAPRQIVVPDEDRVVGPPRVFTDWAKWLDAPIVTISGQGNPTQHMLNVQEPEAFVNEIAQFAHNASRA